MQTRRSGGLGAGALAHALDALTQHARDLHLADADVLADLLLGEVALEAQAHDQTVARREDAHHPAQLRAVLGPAEGVLRGANTLADRAGLVVGAAHRGVERVGVVGERRRPRLDHLLELDAEPLGDLHDGRLALMLCLERVGRARDRDHAILQIARDVHGPRAIAVVALDLPCDGGYRVRGERPPALPVEAVNRLDEADTRDLEDVVEGLVAAHVARGQAAGQRHEALDEHPAPARVAPVGVAGEELAILPRRVCLGECRHARSATRGRRSARGPGWFATPAFQDSPARSREVYGEPVSDGRAWLDEAAFGCAVVQGADRWEIRLEGEIDLAVRPALDDALQTALSVDGTSEVALDLRAVTFADSSAVAWLLAADRLIRGRGGQMTIVGCSAPVRDLLRLTGIDGRLALVDHA